MNKRTRNHSALADRVGELVALYGIEAVAEALAEVLEREADTSLRLPREGVLRRMGRTLRDLAGDARERLDEGLASATGPVIRRKTNIVEWLAPALREGAAVSFVVVKAIRKSGIRKTHGAPRLTTNRAVRAAGGVTRYDLVEVDAYAANGQRLFTDDLPAAALECFAYLT